MANWQVLIAANLDKIDLVGKDTSISASDRSQLADLTRKLQIINLAYASGELHAEVDPENRTEFQRLFSQTQRLQEASTFDVLNHVQNVLSVGPHGWGGGPRKPR
jgi:hypothetical protein